MEKRKLSFNQAQEIRKLNKEGIGYIRLGQKFSLAPETVRDIIKNKTYIYPSQENSGERNNRHKVTEKEVLEIRSKYKKCKNQYDQDCYPCSRLSEEYGIAISAVYKIIKRINWNLI